MKAITLNSRKAAAAYFKDHAPQLSCEYMVSISDNSNDILLKALPINFLMLTDFSMPSSDVNYSISDFGHVTGALSYGGPIELSFIRKSDITTFDPISLYVSSQYINGVPRFIPFKQLPDITIYRLGTASFSAPSIEDSKDIIEDAKKLRLYWEQAMPIVTLNHCRFTYPKPSINFAEDSICVYKTSVSFEDFVVHDSR